MRRSVLVFAVLSLLFAADAGAASRYGGDRVVFRTPAGGALTAGPVLTTAANNRAAIAWASSGRVYVVTDDRGHLGKPVAIPVPETAQTVAVDVNARGDVAVAMARFTGKLAGRDTPGVPCCVDAWVAIRRAGDARFSAPRPVIRRVLGVGPGDVGVKLSPRGRVAVSYDGGLRYTLGRRAERYAATRPDSCRVVSATFDVRDRMIAVCDDGGQASSRTGHRLGGVRYLLGAVGAPVRPQIWTDERGRQIALWDVRWWGPYHYSSGFNVSAAWRTLGMGFHPSRDLGPTDDVYGATYAMAPDGSGAVAHTLRTQSTATDARVVVLPLDTSGDVGRPQTLTAGDGVQLASIAVDRGHALVSWTAKGAGDDHVPWWRLINLDGSATPPAQVLSSRYASPLRLGLTRSYGLAVWEQSTVGPGAPSEEIHARHVYR